MDTCQRSALDALQDLTETVGREYRVETIFVQKGTGRVLPGLELLNTRRVNIVEGDLHRRVRFGDLF